MYYNADGGCGQCIRTKKKGLTPCEPNLTRQRNNSCSRCDLLRTVNLINCQFRHYSTCQKDISNYSIKRISHYGQGNKSIKQGQPLLIG